MSHSTILLLLFLSTLSLGGLALSGVLVSRLQAHQQKIAKRMDSIAIKLEEGRIQLSAFTPPKPKKQPFYNTLARQFGIDMLRTDLYPVKWWVVLLIALGVACVVFTIAQRLVGPYAIIALPAAWVFFSRAAFNWMIGRRKGRLLAQFPEAMAIIVRAVGVGIPVAVAMRSVATEAPEPTRHEFAQLIEQLTIGVTLEDALFAMAHRANLPEYRFFATALALQAQTGGSLSATLEGLADVIRKRLALKARGHALSSEARASGMVLAILPVATGFMMWVMNPDYINVLFVTSAGNTILGVAILSLSVGILVMRMIINKSLS